MIDLVIGSLLFVICILCYLLHWQTKVFRQISSATEQLHNKDRERMYMERQQLLDRIQAPSFDHLKQAEIRLVKAQKEEPAVKYELV